MNDTLWPQEQFLSAFQRGDRDAQSELFEVHKDRLLSIASRFAADPTAAMDVVQDAFLKAISSVTRFRGECALETWLYRIVVNQCFDHNRRSSRLRPLEDAAAARLEAPDGLLADLIRCEREQQVRSAINRLSEELRRVIVLRYSESMSYQEIADLLGCSVGTVGSRLSRAHGRLGQLLARVAAGS